MAQIAVTEMEGTPADFVAASSGGDYFANDGRIILFIKNDGGSDETVTFAGQRPVYEHPDEPVIDRTIDLPALAETRCRPASAWWFNDADGYCQVTYSDHTNLRVRAERARSER